MTTVHVTISGRVQGVGYRAWTVETAKTLGLVGWVRNRSNKTVEAVFQGDDLKLHQMTEKCWQGPVFARVQTVVVSDVKEQEEVYSGFNSRSTL